MYALRLATVALSSVASAQLTFSNVFNSGMVLMRDTPSVVWGFGNASIQVNTTFNGHTYAATVGSDGIWRQPLPSTPAGGPYSIAVAGSDGSSLALNNILFGDVYICSGQSNMQFTVDQGFNASAEAAAANDPKYSSIRVMTVGTSKASGSPLTQFHEVAQNWTAVSSAAIGAGNWSAFSAVCWFFARDVFDGLNGTVPLGMISSNWGGTVIRVSIL